MAIHRIAVVMTLGTLAAPIQAESYFVKNQTEFAAAAKNLKPDDVVILANGEWRDFEISFSGQGQPGKPIRLEAQQPGQVIITGKSNLRLSGSYLKVSGLVFRNGYSPTGEVISFRRDKDDLATDSRVSQTVIDRFNQKDRFQSDYWVALYGKRNRFDHNTLVGKANQGVTLAVRLDSDGSRENGHRIDHNYFGPRPVLGSNGGETLRVGTSAYSMHDSNTIIENNLFDRCDGEIEIVSIKSGGNIVRDNTFLESRGSIVLRHGDGNIVERNIILGRGKDHTGGIRVINRRQIVRDNYIEGVEGVRFASALTIMNGVPNSPVNRYVQVDDAYITRNSIINSARIALSAGADAERSAAPINSRFDNNLLVFNVADPFAPGGSTLGIGFSGNVISSPKTKLAITGVAQRPVNLLRAKNGLLYPVDGKLKAIGAPRDLQTMPADAVGAAYYSKGLPDSNFDAGAKINVSASASALAEAFARANDGDTLILAAGTYALNRTFSVDKRITIKAAAGMRPRIVFQRDVLFELAEGGNLKLQGIDIDGAEAVDYEGNAVIRTSHLPILSNFELELDDVNVRNLAVNKNFNVISLGKSTMAAKLRIVNSNFSNISGKVVEADSEVDDYGRYNIEYLEVFSSHFNKIGLPIISIYRGGNDESTFGPHLLFKGNKVEGNKASAGSLALVGVQQIVIEGNEFYNSAPIRLTQTTGAPDARINGNNFTDTPEPEIIEAKYRGPRRVVMSGNRFDGVVQ